MMRRVLSVAFIVALAACSSGTEPGVPPVDLIGIWSYEGAQDSPVPATLDGALEIESQEGRSFDGSFDVIETTAGEGQRVTGIVTGLALDAATLDFDVLVNGVSRRHVAEVRADTIEGAWVEMRAGGASGTFRAVREDETP